LIELLVVIVLIALLAALLIPAINGARETARRTQCIARQRDLAIALITYDKDKNGLPGYLNQLGETPVHSWAVAIFPMIGENKRYEVLMKGQSPDEARVSPPTLLCPSDNPKEEGRLNYVVNCGPAGINGNITNDVALTFTLFKDRRVANIKVKIDEIPDGASNTILLSENVDAGFWHSGSGSGWVNDAINNLGFIWGPDPDYAPKSLGRQQQHTSLPRPSSYHPAVVIAAYADGSAKPIDDDIEIREWLKAVCPDDEKFPW